jgi:hypothetical protein
MDIPLLNHPLQVSRSALRVFTTSFAVALFSSVTVQAQQTGSSSQQQVAESKVPDEAAALAAQLAAVANQKDTDTDEAAEISLGPAGVVPATKGFNASLTTSSQHDSAGGWSNILSPSIAYRFNKHFSALVEMSVYPYINVVTTHTTKNAQGVVTKTTSALETRHMLLSDTSLSAGFDAHSKLLDYNLTGTMGMPTGDDNDGLGAGQFTYAFVNHFEHPFGDYITPDIELGIDDSPTLLTPRLKKSYLVVGPSAHFQAGLDVSLPWWKMEFETDAYEELPIGANTVNSITTKGKKGKEVTTTTAESAGEDNGFTNTLDIPLGGHATLSGFYNRSLRNHDDTAGFSLTFLLRAPKHTNEGAEPAAK